MKIQSSVVQPVLFNGKQTDQLIKEAKEAINEQIQQQITEMEASKNNLGYTNKKAQQLIEKFKSGKKLTADEMMYVQKHAPSMADYINRMTREREVIELSMKLAPSKIDVQVVVYRASKQLEQYSGEDVEIRAKHITNALHEYKKTADYKEKPNRPGEKSHKPYTLQHRQSNEQPFSRAIAAYREQIDSFNEPSPSR